jgi:hypothetical protein
MHAVNFMSRRLHIYDRDVLASAYMNANNHTYASMISMGRRSENCILKLEGGEATTTSSTQAKTYCVDEMKLQLDLARGVGREWSMGRRWGGSRGKLAEQVAAAARRWPGARLLIESHRIACTARQTRMRAGWWTSDTYVRVQLDIKLACHAPVANAKLRGYLYQLLHGSYAHERERERERERESIEERDSSASFCVVWLGLLAKVRSACARILLRMRGNTYIVQNAYVMYILW